MKIPAIKSFLKVNSYQNNIHKSSCVSKPMAFDSVSFSGKNYEWSDPITGEVGLTTKNENQAFRATRRKKISLHTLVGHIETDAIYYEGGIVGSKSVEQFNPNAVIGRTNKGYSVYSDDSSIKVHARKFTGSIYGYINAIQDNPEAHIGVNRRGKSINAISGYIFTNAKEIDGEVAATGDIYIYGDVNIEGRIVSYEGTIYLVDAKDPSEYRFAEESKVKKISKEEFEENHRFKLMDHWFKE